MTKNNKRNIQFITIEKLENGFLIVCPDMGEGDKQHKECAYTMNSVIRFMEKAWKTKKIEDKNREITNETIVFSTDKQTKPRVFKDGTKSSTDKN